MTPDDPLSQLRDIHLPPTQGFWPPAPGWWVLALVLVVIVAALAWLARRHRRRTLWLRLARAELATLERTALKEPQWFTQLNSLLKRVARERYPLERPEAQSGEQWAACLLRHFPGNQMVHKPVVEALVISAWQAKPAAEPADALDFARRWLEAQKC